MLFSRLRGTEYENNVREDLQKLDAKTLELMVLLGERQH